MKEGFDFCLICPEDGTLRFEAEQIALNYVPVKTLHARFTWNPLLIASYFGSVISTLLDLRRVLKSTNPDFVHANSIRAGMVATLATVGTRIPILWHLHDILPRHPISTLVKFLALSSRRTYLISCCIAAARRFLPSADSWNGKLSVIHNGIDAASFAPDPLIRERSRASLAVDSSDVAIGIVGQITARKDQLGLIRAFPDLLLKVPKAHLMIVGEPLFNKDHEYLDVLKDEIKKLDLAGHVHLLGQRRDVREIMQALDVLVLNSKVEPFSLVVLEAMALSKPVIATDSGGAVEVIKDGENGLIIPVGDQNKLLEALLSLCLSASLRSEYGCRARSTIEAAFTRRHYLGSLRKIYLNVAQQTSVEFDHPISREPDPMAAVSRIVAQSDERA